MADYVLVHGAWCGAWVYRRLAGALAAKGHRVVAVDLAGLGAHRDELHAGIALSTHIGDVVKAVRTAGFGRFTLVGHSYGGMVTTGAAGRLGARIDALVYLDAFVPEDGQALWDLVGEGDHDFWIQSQKFRPGAVAPLPGIMGDQPENGHPPLTAQPLLTLLEGLRFTGEEAKAARRIYVHATGWEPSPFGQFAKRLRRDPSWEFHEFACGHDVMTECHEQVLALLLDCARGQNHAGDDHSGSSNGR